MNTIIYLIRHGDSPKTGEIERLRGLSEKGQADAERVTELLKDEGIDVFVSSPYKRAVLTIEELASLSGKDVLLYEELKERMFSSGVNRMADAELYHLLEKSFKDPHYSLPDAESHAGCQVRAVEVIKELLSRYQGRKIAVGTHGAVMTLMMQHFDERVGLDFLLGTSKPDIYKLTFDGEELIEIKRLWDPVPRTS
ncbi:histidine phosphatase family protein [Rossellomorea marisflavi]|uniref:histidine phosphatase family protein n=1 Tax=Rossellomorea marisflavi TaxID=189381 RepID=UPI0027996C4A|nr:histidine phosphatase family protein [Rossellomorea marisflavi]UTE72299.1 histidine phosphatase family protein [Rossellomorea marisflavi]